MTEHVIDVDYAAFGKEIFELRQELDAGRSNEDYQHLRKIEWLGRLCTGLGLATAWLGPNPFSVFMLSQGTFTRWASVTHHIGHRGYDRVPDVPARKTSKVFARGWRRYIDWLDWMTPDGWDREHNVFHHYYTGETADPDLVERNVDYLRNLRLPIPIKALVILFFMCTWKWFYYAPNTLWIVQTLRKQERGARQGDRFRSIMPDNLHDNVSTAHLFWPFSKAGAEFWLRCLLPYGLLRFVALPALFLPLGPAAVSAVVINLLLAEILTNIHSFIMIVPSHAARDLYRFEGPVRDREEFYVRQVIGSANYRCGGDLNDMFHGWLNYQIEHHLWPDLSMTQYRRAQPRVKAICEKYGVPYLQESVWTRLWKTFRIMTGQDSMLLGRTLSKEERTDHDPLPQAV